jgi:hypothetical protein
VESIENDGRLHFLVNGLLSSRSMKKYEIYLPLKYNDGRKIEAEKIKQIREELIAVFGARTISSQSAPYQGAWKYGAVNVIEDIIKIKSSRPRTGKLRSSLSSSRHALSGFSIRSMS